VRREPVRERTNDETADQSTSHVDCWDKIDQPRASTHQIPLARTHTHTHTHSTAHQPTRGLTEDTSWNITKHRHYLCRPVYEQCQQHANDVTSPFHSIDTSSLLHQWTTSRYCLFWERLKTKKHEQNRLVVRWVTDRERWWMESWVSW